MFGIKTHADWVGACNEIIATAQILHDANRYTLGVSVLFGAIREPRYWISLFLESA